MQSRSRREKNEIREQFRNFIENYEFRDVKNVCREVYLDSFAYSTCTKVDQ